MEAIKNDERWHDFFYLEITTGLRRGEICGLMWTDFDAEKGTLTVRRTLHNKEGGGYYVGETKTGAGRRIIKLPPSTVQLLSERKRTSISQWIFPNPIHPEDPIMPNSGYTRMKKLLAEAGLPDMRFHDLRHTFATHALTSGVDAKNALRHSGPHENLVHAGHLHPCHRGYAPQSVGNCGRVHE